MVEMGVACLRLTALSVGCIGCHLACPDSNLHADALIV